MIQLDYSFISELRSPHQMTVGRQFDDYKKLVGKRANGGALSQNEQDKISDLERVLTQYSTQRHASLQNEIVVRKGDDYGTTNAVVLNVQKLAAANLTGAQRLSIHRDSETLGKLMRKPAGSLSVGEQTEFSRLQTSLMRSVGPTDRPGQLTDFKVTGA